MVEHSPDATFDCLFLANRLESRGETFKAAELHLLAYLGCLLWLYSGRVVSDWGYGFVGTDVGAPFSRAVRDAVDRLAIGGHFGQETDRLRLETSGKALATRLAALELNKERTEHLAAAFETTTAFSIGMVSNALSHEPGLSKAYALSGGRVLLEDTLQHELYGQFEVLRRELPHTQDLRVPAVVWLTALYSSTGVATPFTS